MMTAEQKRKTDNEGVFRTYNEAITDGLDNLLAVAKREGWGNEITTTDDPLHFYCECSREECHERILIRPSEYGTVHENRKRFTILCGHESPSVERVVSHGDDFCVVEKFAYPDEDADTLKETRNDS